MVHQFSFKLHFRHTLNDDEMLDRMQLDYIDLLYVHQPVGDFVGAWKDMEKAVKMGKVRALGISNFDANDEVWNTIMQAATIKPQVLQMECHPYAQRVEMRKKAAAEGIQVECWFPLGGAMSNGALFKDPVIKKIAEAHGKTPAQVILRWHIQEGFSVIPGASNPDYIKENIQIFRRDAADAFAQQGEAFLQRHAGGCGEDGLGGKAVSPAKEERPVG